MVLYNFMVLSRLLKFRKNSLILMCLALSAGGVSSSAYAVELRVNFNVRMEVESYVDHHGIKVDLQAPRVGNIYQWYQNSINGRHPLPPAAETQAQAMLQGSALDDVLAAEQARGHLVERFVGSLKIAETALVAEQQRLNNEGGWAEWIVGSLGEKKDEIATALTDIRARLLNYSDFEDASKLLVANLENRQRRVGTKGTQQKPRQQKQQQQQQQNNSQFNQLQKQLQTQNQQLQTQQQQLQTQQQQLQQLQQQVQQQPQQQQTQPQQQQLTPASQPNTSSPATQPQNQSQQPQNQAQPQQTNPWGNTQWWSQPGPWGPQGWQWPPQSQHAPQQSFYGPPQPNNPMLAQQQPQWGQQGTQGNTTWGSVGKKSGDSQSYSWEDHQNSHMQGSHFSNPQPPHSSQQHSHTTQPYAQPQPSAHTQVDSTESNSAQGDSSSATNTNSNGTLPWLNNTHHLQHQPLQPQPYSSFPSQPGPSSHVSQPANSFSYPPFDQRLYQRLEAISSGLDELKQGQQQLQTHTQAIQELKQERQQQTQMMQGYQQELWQAQRTLPDVAADAARTAANEVALASINVAREAAIQAAVFQARDLEEKATRAAATAATRATADGVAVISARVDQLTQSQQQLQNTIAEMQEQKVADVQALQHHVHEYTHVVNGNTRAFEELLQQQAQTNLIHQQQLQAHQQQLGEALQASRTATNAAGVATEAARAATHAIGEVAGAAAANAAAHSVAVAMDGTVVPWMQRLEQVILEQGSGVHSGETKRDQQQVSRGDENDTRALEQARATFAEEMRTNGILYARWIERRNLLIDLLNNGLILDPNPTGWLEEHARPRAEAAANLDTTFPDQDEQSAIIARIQQAQGNNAVLHQILDELEPYRRSVLEEFPRLLGQLAAEKHGAEAELERQVVTHRKLEAHLHEELRQRESVEEALHSHLVQQEVEYGRAALTQIELEAARKELLEAENKTLRALWAEKSKTLHSLLELGALADWAGDARSWLESTPRSWNHHSRSDGADEKRPQLENIEEMQKQNTAMEQALADLENEFILPAQKELAERLKKLARLRPAIGKLHRDRERAIGGLRKLKAGVEKLTAEKETLLSQNAELAKRGAQIGEEAKNKIADARAYAERAKAFAAKVNGEKERAKEGLRKYKQIVENLIGENKRADREGAGVRAELLSLVDSNRRLRQEHDALKAQVATQAQKKAELEQARSILAAERQITTELHAAWQAGLALIRPLLEKGLITIPNERLLSNYQRDVDYALNLAKFDHGAPECRPRRTDPVGTEIYIALENTKVVRDANTSLKIPVGEMEDWVKDASRRLTKINSEKERIENESKALQSQTARQETESVRRFQLALEVFRKLKAKSNVSKISEQDLNLPHSTFAAFKKVRGSFATTHPEFWNLYRRAELLAATHTGLPMMAQEFNRIASEEFTVEQFREVVRQFEIPEIRFKDSPERVQLVEGESEVGFTEVMAKWNQIRTDRTGLVNELLPEDLHVILSSELQKLSRDVSQGFNAENEVVDKEFFLSSVQVFTGMRIPKIRSLRAMYLLIALDDWLKDWTVWIANRALAPSRGRALLGGCGLLLSKYSVAINEDADRELYVRVVSQPIETATAATPSSNSSTTCSGSENHRTTHPTTHFVELKRDMQKLSPSSPQNDLDNHQSPPVSPKLRPTEALSIMIPEAGSLVEKEPDFEGLPSGTSSLSVSPKSNYYVSVPASPKSETTISNASAGSNSSTMPTNVLAPAGPKHSQSKSQSAPFSFVPSPVKIYLYQPLKLDSSN